METPLPPEINILTLNCWGLKFNISKLRKERLQEIGRQISQTQPRPHIVCLQEVWSHDDYLAIRRSLRSHLPHGKFYHSGAFGAGLAILSHFPIDSASMHPYALNGRPTAFWRGDWYVGKGIAHAALRIGPAPNDIVDVFNTHTHPAYSSSSSSSDADINGYDVHRAAQAWQLAKLLRAAASIPGHLVIAAGDFNMTPRSPMHRILTGHAPVRDVWRVLHPDSATADSKNATAAVGPIPTAAENLTEHGCTSNTITNTWRWTSSQRARLGPGKPLHAPAPSTPDPRGQRLDYIFASTAAREVSYSYHHNDDDDDSSTTTVVGGWVVRDARVGLTQRHPELGCSLSDHFAVEATLVFHTAALQGGADEEEGGDATTIATTAGVPSLSGWPLPPGRLPSIRSSNILPAPPRLPTEGDAASVSPVAAAFNGAFLSLNSDSPSLSHQSSRSDDIQQQQQQPLHNPNSYRRPPPPSAAFDTQLLTSLYQPTTPSAGTFSPSEYTHLLTSLALYTAREKDQTRLRTAHFGFSVFTLVACCIAAWFIPTMHSAPSRLSETQNHAVNFVLVLLSSLSLVAGVVDGLLALLFFAGSERRALRELEWDLRNAKRIALGEVGGSVEVGGGKFD